MFQKENEFEKRVDKFRVDTLGYGQRTFMGCTLLHKMIGQGHYIGIVRFMADMITEKAINEGECQYDGWEKASPLWLVTNLNQNDPRLVSPRKELVSLLVEKGSDVNHLATYTSFADVEDYTTSSPLCEAAKHGWDDIAAILLKNGANATLGDEKPLIEATERLHDEVARLVLESGVDPDMQDKFRHTAMEWAMYNKDDFIINMLKEFGATEIT